MNKSVIYARYSSYKQDEASIEGQLQAAYQYAEQNGISVVGEYIDRAMTAKSDRRPDFQRMIKDSGEGFFDTVLVYQLDRFARKRFDAAVYKKKLQENGVRVVSVKENISDDASGIITEGMIETFAEYFSAQLSEKVSRGMYQNARACKYNGGTLTLGYVIDENKNYQLDPVMAPIIKEMFERYAAGETAKAIMENLNHRGVRSIKGRKLSKNSLQHILRNDKYRGIYKFGDIVVPDGIPRIVTDDIFEQVQINLQKNKHSSGSGKAEENYMLSSKLYCGYCRNKMVGISGQSGGNQQIYRYYKCNGKKDGGRCNKKNIPKDIIEEAVARDCYNALSEENINQIIDLFFARREDGIVKEEINRMKKAIADNEKKIETLMDKLEEGGITDRIEKRIRKREKEIDSLNHSIREQKKKLIPYSRKELRQIFHDLQQGIIKSEKTAKMFIDTLIYRIYAYDDHYNVYFRLDDSSEDIPEGRLISLDRSLNLNENGVPPKSLGKNSGRFFRP